MKSLLSLCFASLPMLTLAAQPMLQSVEVAEIADGVSVDGVIQSAYAIQTGGASYTLVLSRTGLYVSGAPDGEERSARLYASLYVDSADGREQQWRIQDLVDACPVDVTAAFTDPAVAVSDADEDGVAEIWVSYRLACRGDVSPSTLKLIGYEGSQKYALRGTSKVNLGESSEGGEFEPDAAFKNAPKLLKHASGLWMAVRDDRY